MTEKTNILETPEEEAKARAEIAAEEFPEAAGSTTPPAGDDVNLESRSDADKDLKAREEADAAAQAATEATAKADADAVAEAAAKAEVETAEAQKTEDDLYAGMNPALQKHIEGLEATNKALEHRLKSTEGQVGSMIRNSTQAAADAAAEAKKAEAEKEKAPTPEEITAAAESEKDWKDLVEEYPEFTTGISGKLSPLEKRLEIMEKTLADTAEPVDTAGAAGIAEMQTTISQLKVAVKHPDWEEIRSSEDFAAWIVIQSPEIIEQYKSFDSADAITVLDSFKGREGATENKSKPTKTAAEIAQENKDRLKASEALERSGSARASKKPVEKMTDEEYRVEAAEEVFGKP